MGIRRWITDWLVGFLTEPLPGYERRGWNDTEALHRHIRKGDVVLVDGDTRISMMIKYLTQSSWSHSALYIGDELLRRGGPEGDVSRERRQIAPGLLRRRDPGRATSRGRQEVVDGLLRPGGPGRAKSRG